MTYKFLNTIVDDLGAFIIKMPLLHRYSSTMMSCSATVVIIPEHNPRHILLRRDM